MFEERHAQSDAGMRARALKALADPTRFRMVQAVAEAVSCRAGR